MGIPDAVLKNTPWYGQIPGLPPNDDFFVCIGGPALLLGVSHFVRNPGTKEKLKDMAIGAALTGAAILTNSFVMHSLIPALPPVGASVRQQHSPYATEQRMPFQADLTW
jgi:hypothetical protein